MESLSAVISTLPQKTYAKLGLEPYHRYILSMIPRPCGCDFQRSTAPGGISRLAGRAAYEARYGEPYIKDIIPFGCEVVYHDHELAGKDKFEPRGSRGMPSTTRRPVRSSSWTSGA